MTDTLADLTNVDAETLLTTFAALTHRMTGKGKHYDALREQRDIVQAELLKRMGVFGLDDCPWYDVPLFKRPFLMRDDCGGRVEDSHLGIICETHLNAGRK